MATRRIRTLPDPVLRRKTRRVTEIDGSIQGLIEDMLQTMREVNGVGLAANQVGVPLRLCVIEIPPEEDGDAGQSLVLINPEVVTRKGERVLEEGCLSIPGYRGQVRRSVEVRVRALDQRGNPIRVKAVDNLLAQALEHEIDHLNGALYIDHLVDRDSLWKYPEEPEPQDSPAAVAEEACPEPAEGAR